MPIKFKCPHCKRPLSVKEDLAGKRAPCPACKNVLTIPVPTAAVADIEALAASALADEPLARQVAPTTIDFTCPFCDEALHLSPDLGGKQAPCPECRRIIKVPLPAVRDPADWRAVENRGPSGARREEVAAPEGVWGSAAKAVVSREALEEAGALQVDRQPLTTGQRIRRIALVVGVLGVLVIGFFVVRKFFTRSLPEQALEAALQPFQEPRHVKQSPETAAEVFRAAGDSYRLADDPDKALEFFKKSRGALRLPGKAPFDRDLVAADLALTLVDLAGNTNQVDEKTRLSWDEVAKQLRQTLDVLRDRPEARLDALRQVCFKLGEVGQAGLAAELIASTDATSQPALPNAKVKKPRLAALFLALWDPEQARRRKIPAAPKPKEKTDLATRFVHSPGQGNAPRPSLADARKFFLAARDPLPDRLDCLLTVAVVAAAQDQHDEAVACVREAVKMLPGVPKDRPLSAWQVMPWARLAAKLNLANEAQTLAKLLEQGPSKEPALAARVQLEKYLRELKDNSNPAADSWRQAVPNKATLSHARALQEYARHRARNGTGAEMLDTITSIEPESIRPVGYAGVAVGAQERSR
jgi:tetratricopeptide (TPR) repeat protein